MPGEAPALAVVVGTFNRVDLLRGCLDSIRAETSAPIEIHVSDAGSTDGSIDYLQAEAARDLRIKPVFEGERAGQARALNAVFARLTTPCVCWLSDDNLVVNHGLDGGLTALADRPALGMVGLKVRDLRGPFVNAPYIGGLTAAGVLNINQGMLPTRLLQSLGGFAEAYRDYGIDADLTTRVLRAGHEVALTRPVAIHHLRGWPESGTPEAERMAERDRAYKERYHRDHVAGMRPDLGWLATRAVWKAARSVFGRRLHLDSPQPAFGFLVRDWHNMIAGRHIRLFDELAQRDKPYHLVQRP